MQRKQQTVLTINMTKGRYYVKISVEWNKVKMGIECLLDTGATSTQLPRTVLSIIPESNLIQEGIKRRGIVPGMNRSYNKYRTNLIVGDISCPGVDILVPNDTNALMTLLGVDVLTRLTLHQLGGSYQLQIDSPTFKKNNMQVTSSNINQALTDILTERNRLDLYNSIYHSLPSVIDLNYVELYKIVLKFIKEASL